MTVDTAQGPHAPDAVVTRPRPFVIWNLTRGRDTVAGAHALFRPDRRWFVSVDAWRDDDHDALLEAVPVDPATTGLLPALLPPGLVAVPADAVDETLLRELDDALRADVPGNDGWRSDPGEFHDYAFDERHFDPSTSLVAIDERAEAFAGLVRVWAGKRSARLGLVAVAPNYRRRGLGRALLAAAFAAVHERGLVEATAEADETNVAALALLQGIGARRTGSTLELVRRCPRS